MILTIQLCPLDSLNQIILLLLDRRQVRLDFDLFGSHFLLIGLRLVNEFDFLLQLALQCFHLLYAFARPTLCQHSQFFGL